MPSPEGSAGSAAKFGTFQGVFVPSVLTIFGVIMYLRLGWVAGQAGLVGTILIVTIASAITFLTALSIASIATNMRIGAGGAYYMISRSFGLEVGAAVGLPLFFAQALGVSFYATGFGESIHRLAPQLPISWIAALAVAFLGVVAFVSASLAMKTQLIILVVIVSSLVSIFMGSYQPDAAMAAVPEQTGSVPFWVVFAVFFPAVTGIEAGVAMSGNLRNPARALPVGTLAAVVLGYVVYLAIPVVLLLHVPEKILRSDNAIIQKYAFWGDVVLVGIWGATLSSALGALLGAPRTLQALARDRLIPGFLGRGSGLADEPRLATLLTIAIAIGGISLGSLDVIAPVLSMFFLTSYAFINLATAVEGMIGSPTWRPSFRTPWGISLIGSLACAAAMLMIDAGSTFMAAFLTFGVYWLTKRRGLAHGWADLRRGMLFMMARAAIYRLASFDRTEGAKSWQPNLLVLSGSPASRWYLIDFAHTLTRGQGFLAIAAIVTKKGMTGARLESLERSTSGFLRRHDVSALVEITPAEDESAAVRYLIESFGLGPIYPNTIVVGVGNGEDEDLSAPDLGQVIATAHNCRRNVILMRDSEPAQPDGPAVRHRGVIRIWWNRDFKQNAHLMLAIAYLLNATRSWRRCEIVLSSLVGSPQESEGAHEHLEEFLRQARMDARPEIFTKDESENWYEAIERRSMGDELTLIGIRPLPPVDGELDAAAEAPAQEALLREHCDSLLGSTAKLRRVLYVAAAQDLDFRTIFA